MSDRPSDLVEEQRAWRLIREELQRNINELGLSYPFDHPLRIRSRQAMMNTDWLEERLRTARAGAITDE